MKHDSLTAFRVTIHSGWMGAAATRGHSTVAACEDLRVPQVELPAFSDLYRDHADYIWRVLRRVGLDDAAAEDALQEVFVVAFRRRGDFEGRSSIRTWLCGIAIRVARDMRKRISTHATAELDDVRQVASADSGPEKRAEHAEAVVLLERVLAALDSPKREVFVLAEIEELTAPEISEVLGIPVNSVYSRLRLAREQFERALSRVRAKERGDR